ncbi:MAG: cytochrome d ubiquinol oxidase subunit II [bacterium]|nr:cytochrome d ubiquinol oxidase subunit II [Gemmatimonadota bacterium]
MSFETLALTWGALLGVLLAGYAILDGFDLGVGILHPFVPRDDREKRISLNSIGPLWDGNEVWLVTFGGALFAAFPEAYASAFSGFYLAFVALLFALIFRAVSLEFRSKVAAPAWRAGWDAGFFASSFLASLLFGVAVGNVMRGLPLSARGDYVGGTLDLLHPYALLTGAFVVSLFALHGGIFLMLKTTGELRARARRAVWRAYAAFVVLYAAVSIATWISVPEAVANFAHARWLWVVPVLNLAAVINVARAVRRGRGGEAFVSSALAIVALVALFAAAMFPNLLRSDPLPEHSLTLFNAASSARTLEIMLLIAALGLPFVLTYTVIIYRTYRGPVELGDHSY